MGKGLKYISLIIRVRNSYYNNIKKGSPELYLKFIFFTTLPIYKYIYIESKEL